MNTQTITDKIYERSDAELRAKVAESQKWIWDAIRENNAERPIAKLFPEIECTTERLPWLGEFTVQFDALVIAYLRDLYREKAVSAFMAKVNNMAAEMENLGIVVMNRENENA